MDKFWKAVLAVGGLAAIGAFVFWSLYKKWLSLPIFSKMSPDQTFWIMIIFLSLTFVVPIVLVAVYYLKENRKNTNLFNIIEGNPHHPERFSKYVSAPIVIIACFIAAWFYATTGTLPNLVINGLAMLGLAVAIFRIQPLLVSYSIPIYVIAYNRTIAPSLIKFISGFFVLLFSGNLIHGSCVYSK